MDIKQQCITGYLTLGTGYRQLAAKYGVSRTTINKWVMIHQGIHTLPPTQKQQKYYLSGSVPAGFSQRTLLTKDNYVKLRLIMLLQQKPKIFYCLKHYNFSYIA